MNCFVTEGGGGEEGTEITFELCKEIPFFQFGTIEKLYDATFGHF